MRERSLVRIRAPERRLQFVISMQASLLTLKSNPFIPLGVPMAAVDGVASSPHRWRRVCNSFTELPGALSSSEGPPPAFSHPCFLRHAVRAAFDSFAFAQISRGMFS